MGWGRLFRGFATVSLLAAVSLTVPAAVASAIEPIDMPPLTCDELIYPGWTAEAQAAKDSVVASRKETGQDSTFVESIDVEHLVSSPSSTSCTWLIGYWGAGLSVEAITPESLARFTESTRPREYLTQISVNGIPAFQLEDPEGATIYLSYNGFLYVSNVEEWLTSAISQVDSRMAELNAPPPEAAEEPAPKKAEAATLAKRIQGADVSANSPSVLHKLQTLFDLKMTIGSLGATAGGAVVLTMLLIFPTALLQRVLNRRYSTVASKLRKSTGALGEVFRASTTFISRLPKWLSVSSGLLIASVLSGLVSPTFGFNVQSVRVWLSILTALIVESLLLLSLTRWWVKRRGGISQIDFRAGSLLIILTTVIFTRLTAFEPGIVFGLVMTLLLVSSSLKVNDWKVSTFETSMTIVFGLLAWVVYSLLVVSQSNTTVLTIFTQETASALTLGTLTALPLVLLPFGTLPGRKLFQSRKLIWSVLFGISLLLFFVIVMPFPESVQVVSWPLLSWILFFVIYALIAVAIWAIDWIIESRKKEEVKVSSESLNQPDLTSH